MQERDYSVPHQDSDGFKELVLAEAIEPMALPFKIVRTQSGVHSLPYKIFRLHQRFPMVGVMAPPEPFPGSPPRVYREWVRPDRPFAQQGF